MTVLMVQERPAQATPDSTLARLVDAIGGDRFGPALANYLNELCGADHFAAFHLGRGARFFSMRHVPIFENGP